MPCLLPLTGTHVGTGVYEYPRSAMVDALRNSEFVHMQDVESLVVTYGGQVATAAANAPPRERMRATVLGSDGKRMTERWAALWLAS